MDEFKKGQEVIALLDKEHSTEGDSADHKGKFVAYHLDRHWADVELEAEHAGKTTRLSVPVAILKAALVLLAVLCSALPVRAQFIGYTSPQTVTQTALTAANSPTTFSVSNLGQNMHFLSYTKSGTINVLDLRLEGSNDGVTFFPISDDAVDVTTTAGVLYAVGYYPVVRVNLAAIFGGGTITANYTGTSSSSSPPLGTYAPGQVYRKLVINRQSQGTNGGATILAPYGSTAGYLLCNSTQGAAFPAGSTISVSQIIANNGLAFALPATSLSAAVSTTIPVNAYPASALSINYLSGGASANDFSCWYIFTPPQGGIQYVPASYRAAISFSPTATAATDIFLIGGSATKTVRVTHLGIACTATAAVAADVIFLKRSSADTAGTSTGATAVALDSGDSAATATVLAYTANPTVGGLFGNVSIDKSSITTTTGAPQFLFEDFGVRNTRSVVLRGTAQQLAINLNGASIAGIACDAEVEWTEE